MMAQRGKSGGKSKAKDASLPPPDRKKHEDELEALMVQIREKEAGLKALGRRVVDRDAQKQTSSQLDSLYVDLSKLRAQKDSCVEKRHGVDIKIREVNDDISKKSDEANKMSATLRYKTAERVDEALARLENRKQTRQLTAQEETDLQTEIKELTESKPAIIAYNECRANIDAERARQSDLRRERDNMTEELSQLRVKEDDVRVDIEKLRTQIDKEKQLRKSQNDECDSVSKELNQLYAQRREKMANFRQAQNDFHLRELDARDAATAKRDEERRKARQERALDKTERQREKLESQAVSDPALVKRQDCAALINYLSKMNVSETNGTASSGGSTGAAVASQQDVDALTPVRGDVAKPGAFLSRKTREDDYSGADSLFAGKGKKGKKGKKGPSTASSKASARAIRHNAIVLGQFMSVDVRPPASVSNIPATIEELQEKESTFTQYLVDKYGSLPGLDLGLAATATASPVNGTATHDVNADGATDTVVTNGDAVSEES